MAEIVVTYIHTTYDRKTQQEAMSQGLMQKNLTVKIALEDFLAR